jgi:hypothetical protein
MCVAELTSMVIKAARSARRRAGPASRSAHGGPARRAGEGCPQSLGGAETTGVRAAGGKRLRWFAVAAAAPEQHTGFAGHDRGKDGRVSRHWQLPKHRGLGGIRHRVQQNRRAGRSVPTSPPGFRAGSGCLVRPRGGHRGSRRITRRLGCNRVPSAERTAQCMPVSASVSVTATCAGSRPGLTIPVGNPHRMPSLSSRRADEQHLLVLNYDRDSDAEQLHLAVDAGDGCLGGRSPHRRSVPQLSSGR